jgi:PAS domain S-box-containing protein
LVGVIVSLLSTQSPSEQIAANTCSVDNLRRPYRWELTATSTSDFVRGLSEPLGRLTAEREVQMALADLGMDPAETRPYALRRLRDQIESNLSGLLGPSVAQDILDQHLPYKVRTEQGGSAEDIHYIESRLEDYRDRLSGLAAELDSLRRFHRQTLFDLPIGVCSLGKDLEILSWNNAMTELTGITDEQVIGSRLNNLPAPWHELFMEFLHGPSAQVYRKPVEAHGETHWVSLNRAVIGDGDSFGHPDSQVIVVEDISELHRLEVRLSHNERLASIGRLAAGVAHEIGNPVTGIACLAQNLKAETDRHRRPASQPANPGANPAHFPHRTVAGRLCPCRNSQPPVRACGNPSSRRGGYPVAATEPGRQRLRLPQRLPTRRSRPRRYPAPDPGGHQPAKQCPRRQPEGLCHHRPRQQSRPQCPF